MMKPPNDDNNKQTSKNNQNKTRNNNSKMGAKCKLENINLNKTTTIAKSLNKTISEQEQQLIRKQIINSKVEESSSSSAAAAAANELPKNGQKLMKKSYVRFDDYLDLNEENMRRSCKKLMNHLYSEPNSSASAATTTCNGLFEVASSTVVCTTAITNNNYNDKTMAALEKKNLPLSSNNFQSLNKFILVDNKSLRREEEEEEEEENGQVKRIELVSEKNRNFSSLTSTSTSYNLNNNSGGKSYLRSQYERRQLRQLQIASNKNYQNQKQQEEHLQIQRQNFQNQVQQQQKNIKEENFLKQMPTTQTANTMEEFKKRQLEQEQEQQDLVVAKSHELSKRRFFEKLEQRESQLMMMKNNNNNNNTQKRKNFHLNNTQSNGEKFSCPNVIADKDFNAKQLLQQQQQQHQLTANIQSKSNRLLAPPLPLPPPPPPLQLNSKSLALSNQINNISTNNKLLLAPTKATTLENGKLNQTFDINNSSILSKESKNEEEEERMLKVYQSILKIDLKKDTLGELDRSNVVEMAANCYGHKNFKKEFKTLNSTKTKIDFRIGHSINEKSSLISSSSSSSSTTTTTTTPDVAGVGGLHKEFLSSNNGNLNSSRLNNKSKESLLRLLSPVNANHNDYKYNNNNNNNKLLLDASEEVLSEKNFEIRVPELVVSKDENSQLIVTTEQKQQLNSNNNNYYDWQQTSDRFISSSAAAAAVAVAVETASGLLFVKQVPMEEDEEEKVKIFTLIEQMNDDLGKDVDFAASTIKLDDKNKNPCNELIIKTNTKLPISSDDDDDEKTKNNYKIEEELRIQKTNEKDKLVILPINNDIIDKTQKIKESTAINSVLISKEIEKKETNCESNNNNNENNLSKKLTSNLEINIKNLELNEDESNSETTGKGNNNNNNNNISIGISDEQNKKNILLAKTGKEVLVSEEKIFCSKTKAAKKQVDNEKSKVLENESDGLKKEILITRELNENHEEPETKASFVDSLVKQSGGAKEKEKSFSEGIDLKSSNDDDVEVREGKNKVQLVPATFSSEAAAAAAVVVGTKSCAAQPKVEINEEEQVLRKKIELTGTIKIMKDDDDDGVQMDSNNFRRETTTLTTKQAVEIRDLLPEAASCDYKNDEMLINRTKANENENANAKELNQQQVIEDYVSFNDYSNSTIEKRTNNNKVDQQKQPLQRVRFEEKENFIFEEKSFEKKSQHDLIKEFSNFDSLYSILNDLPVQYANHHSLNEKQNNIVIDYDYNKQVLENNKMEENEINSKNLNCCEINNLNDEQKLIESFLSFENKINLAPPLNTISISNHQENNIDKETKTTTTTTTTIAPTSDELDCGGSSCGSSGFGASGISVTCSSSSSSSSSTGGCSPLLNTTNNNNNNHNHNHESCFSMIQNNSDSKNLQNIIDRSLEKQNGHLQKQHQHQKVIVVGYCNQQPVYDTICVSSPPPLTTSTSSLPLEKQLELEFPDYKQLVGPDEEYPLKKKKIFDKESCCQVLIENHNYSPIIKKQDSNSNQEEKNLNYVEIINNHSKKFNNLSSKMNQQEEDKFIISNNDIVFERDDNNSPVYYVNLPDGIRRRRSSINDQNNCFVENLNDQQQEQQPVSLKVGNNSKLISIIEKKTNSNEERKREKESLNLSSSSSLSLFTKLSNEKQKLASEEQKEEVKYAKVKIALNGIANNNKKGNNNKNFSTTSIATLSGQSYSSSSSSTADSGGFSALKPAKLQNTILSPSIDNCLNNNNNNNNFSSLKREKKIKNHDDKENENGTSSSLFYELTLNDNNNNNNRKSLLKRFGSLVSRAFNSNSSANVNSNSNANTTFSTNYSGGNSNSNERNNNLVEKTKITTAIGDDNSLLYEKKDSYYNNNNNNENNGIAKMPSIYPSIESVKSKENKIFNKMDKINENDNYNYFYHADANTKKASLYSCKSLTNFKKNEQIENPPPSTKDDNLKKFVIDKSSSSIANENQMKKQIDIQAADLIILPNKNSYNNNNNSRLEKNIERENYKRKSFLINHKSAAGLHCHRRNCRKNHNQHHHHHRHRHRHHHNRNCCHLNRNNQNNDKSSRAVMINLNSRKVSSRESSRRRTTFNGLRNKQSKVFNSSSSSCSHSHLASSLSLSSTSSTPITTSSSQTSSISLDNFLDKNRKHHNRKLSSSSSSSKAAIEINNSSKKKSESLSEELESIISKSSSSYCNNDQFRTTTTTTIKQHQINLEKDKKKLSCSPPQSCSTARLSHRIDIDCIEPNEKKIKNLPSCQSPTSSNSNIKQHRSSLLRLFGNGANNNNNNNLTKTLNREKELVRVANVDNKEAKLDNNNYYSAKKLANQQEPEQQQQQISNGLFWKKYSTKTLIGSSHANSLKTNNNSDKNNFSNFCKEKKLILNLFEDEKKLQNRKCKDQNSLLRNKIEINKVNNIGDIKKQAINDDIVYIKNKQKSSNNLKKKQDNNNDVEEEEEEKEEKEEEEDDEKEDKHYSLNLYKNLLRNYTKRKGRRHSQHKTNHCHHNNHNLELEQNNNNNIDGHRNNNNYICGNNNHHHHHHNCDGRNHKKKTSNRHSSRRGGGCELNNAKMIRCEGGNGSGYSGFTTTTNYSTTATSSIASSAAALALSVKMSGNDERLNSSPSVWGQLIKINKSDGSQEIELERIPEKSWGFFVARGAINDIRGIFISRMHGCDISKSTSNNQLTGLLSIGDRILAIDDNIIEQDYDILRVNQMISKKTKILLKVKPFKG